MTAWSRAGSSYVRECRPGYEAVVELSGACAYAAPLGHGRAGGRGRAHRRGAGDRPRRSQAAEDSRGDVTWRRRRRRQEGVRCAHRRGGGQGRGSRDQGMAPRRARRHPLGGRAGIARRSSGAPAVARLPGRRAGGAPCFAVASAGGDGYAAPWPPDGALGSAAVESGPCPTPSEALARLAERLVDQGMPAAGGEDDDLARYERLYAGDMETYKSTNLDELIRACRASARYGLPRREAVGDDALADDGGRRHGRGRAGHRGVPEAGDESRLLSCIAATATYDPGTRRVRTYGPLNAALAWATARDPAGAVRPRTGRGTAAPSPGPIWPSPSLVRGAPGWPSCDATRTRRPRATGGDGARMRPLVRQAGRRGHPVVGRDRLRRRVRHGRGVLPAWGRRRPCGRGFGARKG